ncbi:MAG: hypothetical protein WA211_07870 [Candidatus Acidiferrales bacterium]
MVGFFSKATCGFINKSVILLILFGSASAVAQEQVTFTIVDRVQFTVHGDWPVIASKSTAEKTIFGFQIPNTADEGTPDSSNLSIVSSNLKDAQDKDAFEKKASSRAPHAQEKKLVDGWRCSSFLAMQKSTQYVDWDCYRVVADCGVFVRIAWPHLPKNPSDYDKQMETVLSDFLTSVGPSKKQSN